MACRLLAVSRAFRLFRPQPEVGKAALIATTGDLIDLPTNRYPLNWSPKIEIRAHSARKNLPAQYRGAQHLPALDHELYFVNYLPIDEALHQDAQETGRVHAEVIYDNLTTVAKSVADFAQRFHLQKRLTVYVLSDHGATRIAKGVVNVLDAAFYKSLTIKNHHRYVALSDDKFKSLPQAAIEQCYLIDRSKFKTLTTIWRHASTTAFCRPRRTSMFMVG